jgi:hypothetical protein
MVLIQYSKVRSVLRVWIPNGEQEQLLMPKTELLPFLTIFGTTMRAISNDEMEKLDICAQT